MVSSLAKQACNRLFFVLVHTDFFGVSPQAFSASVTSGVLNTLRFTEVSKLFVFVVCSLPLLHVTAVDTPQQLAEEREREREKIMAFTVWGEAG